MVTGDEWQVMGKALSVTFVSDFIDPLEAPFDRTADQMAGLVFKQDMTVFLSEFKEGFG